MPEILYPFWWHYVHWGWAKANWVTCKRSWSLGNTCRARWCAHQLPWILESRASNIQKQRQKKPGTRSDGSSVHLNYIWIWLQLGRLLVCVGNKTKKRETGTHCLAARNFLFEVGIVGLDHSLFPWRAPLLSTASSGIVITFECDNHCD